MDAVKSSNLCYWEPISSTVDWCERNCVYSQYIAEFFNSISNLGILIPPIFGIMSIIRCQKGHIEKRFLVLYGCQIIVALGSFLFHATLTKIGQFLDPTKQYRYLPYALLGYGCIILTTAIFNVAPIFFQGTFGCILAFVLLRTYKLGITSKESRNIRHLFILGMSCWGIGIICWIIDYNSCAFLEDLPFRNLFQLHAWWHVLTGMGSYCAGVFYSYQRISRQTMNVHVAFYLGLPYLQRISVRKFRQLSEPAAESPKKRRSSKRIQS
jgi:dihydroceramidase